MDSDRDLYQILQVDPAAEPGVVQAAFKRLALKYHPDKNSSPDAHRRMQELNEAYAIIGDPYQRAAYDRERQEKLKAQRQAEEQARYQAEADRRAEAARQRKEQAAAQRRAQNERQEQARATAEQRRVEYDQRIRAEMAAQQRAKRERQERERQKREQEARQAAEQPPVAQQPVAQPAAPIEAPMPEPAPMPEVPVQAEVEQGPIDILGPSESERRQLVLLQSRRALQDEIFKLDYGITDAVEQAKYWGRKRFPLQISLLAGQRASFIIGSAVTIFALFGTGSILAFSRGIGWAVACLLIGAGAGWFTMRSSVSILTVGYLVKMWTNTRHKRELQRKHLTAELAQLEAAMQAEAARVDSVPSIEIDG